MKILIIPRRLFFAIIIITITWAFTYIEIPAPAGQTEITKWQYGKDAALSLTYDDSSINQFTQAIPIMDRLNFPATFFVITGNIAGSQNQGKFIGRPVQTIINETAKIPTNKDNFFERASAIGFLGYEGTAAFHKQAGTLYDGGKAEEAYKYIDESYKKIRDGEVKRGNSVNEWFADTKVSWNDMRKFASRGHEISSHMVTHPRLAALDEVNMLYELEKSKADILRELGPKHTFSAECPFGTENERVMEYAHKVYPALRNRMPEPWLEEINRSNNRVMPGSSPKEYVQYQRGATTKTPLPMIKSWVDTVLTHKNNWLLLTIHGVDGIGWEALPHEMLDEYFQYIKSKENQIWVATFGDVTKYMRERMNAKVISNEKSGKILVSLTHSLDKAMYDVPLTLKTYVSSDWNKVQTKQGNKTQSVQPRKDDKGTYILYQVLPNSNPIELSGV